MAAPSSALLRLREPLTSGPKEAPLAPLLFSTHRSGTPPATCARVAQLETICGTERMQEAPIRFTTAYLDRVVRIGALIDFAAHTMS